MSIEIGNRTGEIEIIWGRFTGRGAYCNIGSEETFWPGVKPEAIDFLSKYFAAMPIVYKDNEVEDHVFRNLDDVEISSLIYYGSLSASQAEIETIPIIIRTNGKFSKIRISRKTSRQNRKSSFRKMWQDLNGPKSVLPENAHIFRKLISKSFPATDAEKSVKRKPAAVYRQLVHPDEIERVIRETTLLSPEPDTYADKATENPLFGLGERIDLGERIKTRETLIASGTNAVGGTGKDILRVGKTPQQHSGPVARVISPSQAPDTEQSQD